jgi:hypothetical protein
MFSRGSVALAFSTTMKWSVMRRGRYVAAIQSMLEEIGEIMCNALNQLSNDAPRNEKVLYRNR